MAKKKRYQKKTDKWGKPPKHFSPIPLFVMLLSGAVYFNLSRTVPETTQISVVEEFTCESLETENDCSLSELCAWVSDGQTDYCVTLEQ